MKKIFLFLSTMFMLTSCLTVNGVYDLMQGKGESFTNEEAVSALREALVKGAEFSSKTLSAQDGYYGDDTVKILLPEEAAVIISAIDKIPGGNTLIKDVILRINRSAEEGAGNIVPIFKEAVMSMSVTDGIKIVTGGENACTEYLRDKTYNSLYDLYLPVVTEALDMPLVLNVSANKSWASLMSGYNKVAGYANSVARLAGKEDPMPEVNVNLPDYVTKKALDGIFLKMSEEEKKIRENPFEYSSKIIEKVFGSLLPA